MSRPAPSRPRPSSRSARCLTHRDSQMTEKSPSCPPSPRLLRYPSNAARCRRRGVLLVVSPRCVPRRPRPRDVVCVECGDCRQCGDHWRGCPGTSGCHRAHSGDAPSRVGIGKHTQALGFVIDLAVAEAEAEADADALTRADSAGSLSSARYRVDVACVTAGTVPDPPVTRRIRNRIVPGRTRGRTAGRTRSRSRRGCRLRWELAVGQWAAARIPGARVWVQD